MRTSFTIIKHVFFRRSAAVNHEGSISSRATFVYWRAHFQIKALSTEVSWVCSTAVKLWPEYNISPNLLLHFVLFFLSSCADHKLIAINKDSRLMQNSKMDKCIEQWRFVTYYTL